MRRLQFKFLSQIRISGWDFGSSARAMNQAGGFISTQADLEKVSRSTTERKSMSTKTTIKRIALVAVSALGLGVLTSVAPASATAGNAITPTAVAVGTIPTTAVGVQASIPVTITAPIATNNDTFTVTVLVTSAPAGSALASVAGAGTQADGSGAGDSFIDGVYAVGSTNLAKITLDEVSTNATLQVGTPTQKSDLTPSVSSLFTSSGSDASLPETKGSIYVKFQPDKAGTYTFRVSAHAGAPTVASAAYAAGDAFTTFSVSTGSTPATVALTKIGSAPVAGSSYGQLVKVTLKDAAGTAASLAVGEILNLAPSSSTTTLVSVNALTGGNITAASAGATLALSSTDFSSGVAYVRVTDSASTATTTVLTATGAGSLSAGVTNTTSITTVVAAGTTTSVSIADPTGSTRPGGGHRGVAGTYTDQASLSASSHSYLVTDTASCTAAATKKVSSTILDSAGDITGVVGITVDGPVTTFTCLTAATSSTGSITVSGALSTADDAFTLTVGGTGSAAIVVTGKTAAVKTATASPANSFKLATGGSAVLQAKVTDQFGAAVANAAVTVGVTGRNATTANVNLATDANGYVSYTLTDASTSTTSLTDTVTFTATGATAQVSGANVVTITYGTYTAKTITITGGNSTASVDAATDSPIGIYAGDGVENGSTTFTATVKDANGALLVGVPVVFTVSGTGAAVLSTTQTVYTGTAGTAAATVYAWIAGKYTVTATSGTASGTATGTWANSTATTARIISASKNGNVVTGKAVDRLGNPVQGVTLYASTSAPANIGGLFVASATTGSDGTAKWVVTGSGSVTVSAVSPTAVAGTTYGQTCALAGNIDCAVPGTAATAFTASTAGTSTKAETYVGASFAPAGVASASVDVSDTTASDSVDAANEATDAANAATDAANAAAEAADAATAAAQDAQAAVAALASQVADLIAGIKAQITALTNLVIKIQKKVKA